MALIIFSALAVYVLYYAGSKMRLIQCRIIKLQWMNLEVSSRSSEVMTTSPMSEVFSTQRRKIKINY